MKARIFKNQIHITPCPKETTKRLYIALKESLDNFSEPYCFTNINCGQKVYQLPETKRKNITGVFIR